jgi:DNA-binding MarR family transcriptional regulator
MEEYLFDSLYFNISRLNRNISRIADEEFKKIKIPPSYGLLIMLLNEWKELTPSRISESMDIKPSTTTRFLDKLQKQGFITRRSEGKFSYISLSSEGLNKVPEIMGAFETLELKLNKLVTLKYSDRQKILSSNMADRIKEKIK